MKGQVEHILGFEDHMSSVQLFYSAVIVQKQSWIRFVKIGVVVFQ